MKIMIIGCNGFVGSNMADYFYRLGWQVNGCDTNDLATPFINYFKTNQENDGLDVFLESNVMDVCINAAGSGNVGYSIQNPMADFSSNAGAVIRILNLLKLHQPTCKYLHISSAAVYGNPKQLPVEEIQDCAPISPYGYHKWISEIICREYHHLFKMQVAILRPFSIYGPGQKKLLLWDICNKLREKDKVQLFGTGNESRDFIHVKDLAMLAANIIEAGKFSADIFNAASGTETTISQVAAIFTEYYGGVKELSFSGEVRAGDPLNWRADMSRASSIGFVPSIDLKEGVHQYIKWVEGLK